LDAMVRCSVEERSVEIQRYIVKFDSS